MTEQDILIMNSDSTHVDVELSFDNGINTIKNNKIYSESMSLIDSVSDSESIVFGKCNISQFQVKVADFEGNIDGALMNVLLKFSSAELGGCEYNLGQYIVSDSERTSDKMFRIITAYDKMSLFNKDIANWYNYTLFPFEVVDNNLGWLPVNENGVVIDLTYSVAGEPQTSLDKNDDGAYYLNTNDGVVYVGYATYDESGEFASVEWRTYLQCEKNESYTESCNITRTVNEILAMLCEYVGVPYNEDFVLVNGGITVGRDYNPQSLNGLDFLQQICELNGVFGHINNNGILDFIAPDKSKKQTVDTFKKCDYSEYTVQPINSVSIKHDSNDMGTTVTRSGIDKLNQYEIVGNIFLQSIKREDELNTIAEKILSVIENVTYVPCSVEVKCGLNFGLGDFITVNAKTIKEESVSSVSFDTLVLCRNISGIQSIFNRIEAKGTEYVNKNAESLSSQLQITNKTIDKLYKEYTANVANFMHLYSKAITTDSLTSNIANIGTLNANSAFVKFLKTNVVDANYIRAVTADIGYLTADSAIISNLQTNKLNTSDLNAENAKLGYLTASSAVITGKLDANQLSAEVAKLGYLDAKMANIDFANLNKANIGQLFANVGLISSATIADGHVTGYLDSVEVNANKITAGTLAVDRLLIKDSSGNYKMATYDSSGNLVTTTINGSVITNRTITADHLVAGTITANEINMTNLVGNSAFVNAINTNSIVVSASNNASSALSTANTANSNASTALSTANTANSNASSAISKANSANTKAQGIIDNIYTPNTTTINGGKITTGSIKAAQIAAGTITANKIAAGTITANKINLNDLFAQNITATGTITGATLKGATITANKLSLSETTTYDGTYNSVFSLNSNSDNTSLRYELQSKSNNKMLYFSNIKQGYDSTNYSGYVKLEGGASQTGGSLIVRSGGVFVNNLNSSGSISASETIYENGIALSNKYLGINANAVSSLRLTTLDDKDKASDTSTWRRVWISCNNNTEGRPAWTDNLTFQTSTNTLKTTNFEGNLIGNATGLTNGNSKIYLSNNSWHLYSQRKSGNDEGLIIDVAPNGYAGLTLGSPTGRRSVFYLSDSNAFWRYNNGSASYDIHHPSKGGTIALTSDFSSASVNYANTAGSAPASDVYSWAKQSTKPSYAINEISGSSDIFKIATYTYASVTISGGGASAVSPASNNIPSGYTAVAVSMLNTGTAKVYARNFLSGGSIILVNTSSSSVSTTPAMKVLCVKSICVG